MGWASGSYLAEHLWGIVAEHINAVDREDVAQEIIDAFEEMDCDTIDEAESLCLAAGWKPDEEGYLCRTSSKNSVAS